MAVSLGKNLQASRIVQRLGAATQAVSQSFERLSTGQRINRAADDAAGLAISESLKGKERILRRGEGNLNDGISALSIVDGSLQQISSIVQRQAELASEAANGAYSSTQRDALNAEYMALDKEIRRIADTTQFNGIYLLKGQRQEMSKASLGVGSGSYLNVSGDGRYATYRDSSNNIVQRDLVLGISTTLVASATPTGMAASASGEVVAFISTQNISGLNPSARSMAFLYNRNDGTVRSLVQSAAGEAVSGLSVSADGSVVAFVTQGQYSTSGSNSAAVGVPQYLHSYNTELSTVTNHGSVADGGQNTVFETAVSSGGTYIGVVEDDPGGNGMVVATVQVAGGAIVSREVSLSGEFTRYAQISEAGLMTFANGEDPASLYSYNTATSTLSLLSTVDLGALSSLSPIVMSVDGSYLTFLSGSNFAETTSYHLRGFRYDFATATFTEQSIDSTDTVNAGGALSLDGTTYLYQTATLQLADVGRGALSLSIDSGTGTGSSGEISASISAVQSALRGINGQLVSTASAGRGALDAARRNVSLLGELESRIGAALSRLSSASRLVSAQNQEIISARSRISSSDVAEEAARSIKGQIQQKSIMAILAQANQSPQIALRLLGG